MGIKKFLRDNKVELISLYSQTKNITQSTRELCERKGVKYSDAYRRRASELLYKNRAKVNITPAKILIFDIETAPIEAFIWSPYQTYIPSNQIKHDWFIISWAAKWLFDDKVYSDVLTPKEALAKDDQRITRSLWHMLDEADIVIAHNGKKFDEKKSNTRFFKYGMNPTSSYLSIDTLRHLKNKLALTYNKLDWVAVEFLGLEGKIATDFELWKGCIEGKKESLSNMETYNIQDIHVLEELYLKLRPWIQPHPNISLYVDDAVSRCNTCGSENLTEDGIYCTYATAYTAHRCNDCGSINRSRSALTSAEKKKVILYSIPT